MSKYTTGEIAKRCGVSVRTVQYYDSRGILIPSELTEGGRRLYTEEDVTKLEIICFLRETGLSINSIAQLLAEEDPGSVISVLLAQQRQEVHAELEKAQKKLAVLDGISHNLKTLEHVDFHSIGDIAHMMNNKKKLKKVRTVLLSTGIPFTILEWASVILWIVRGIWWTFAVFTVLAVPYIVWMFRYHWKNISYICPKCHAIFKPGKKEAFFASHTPTARKLTCTGCGHRGFCVETCCEPVGEAEKE